MVTTDLPCGANLSCCDGEEEAANQRHFPSVSIYLAQLPSPSDSPLGLDLLLFSGWNTDFFLIFGVSTSKLEIAENRFWVILRRFRSTIQNLTWFHELLDEKGNLTHVEFLERIHSSGEISLQNFTDTLTEVVYPQCMVSEESVGSR